MPKTISVSLSAKSILSAIKEVEKYRQSIARKQDELCKRLAAIGATRISLGYARAVYSGNKDIAVHVEAIPNGYAIVAQGESVLFVEFGAGARYGYGHPMSEELGMGPGTWPDPHYRKNSYGDMVANWENPQGWWIPGEHGGGHTYGNPASAVMYETSKELEGMVLQIAREVFADG